jgi:SNF2 family DNA or RNA helicase
LKYLIVNIESFQTGEVPEVVMQFLKRHPKPFIVLDESSKIKSNKAMRKDKKSKRTQAIHKLNGVGHRAILTGTFMSKSPVNIYDQMEFLEENYFGEDMFSFESRYCIMAYMPIGRGIRTLISEELYARMHRDLNRAYKTGGAMRLDATMARYLKTFRISERKQQWIMQHEAYSPFMGLKDLYERVKDDVMIVKKEDANDLPPKVYKSVRVPPTEEMKKLYDSLLKTGFTEDVVAANGISLYHRFQDICNGYIPKQDDPESKVYLDRQRESPKLLALMDELEDINTKNHQVVVWANRKLLLHDIVAALEKEGYETCLFDGDTNDIDRQKISENFRAGKIRVFVGNQQSGAYGLDFLKKANYEIFVSNDYSVERREQAEDRIHRGEEREQKTVVDIVIAGTVDERVTKSLWLGKELIHSGSTDKAIFEREEIIF